MKKDSVIYLNNSDSSPYYFDGLPVESIALTAGNSQHEAYSGSEPPYGYEGIKPFFSLEQVEGIFALLLICFLFFTYVYKRGLNFFRENISLIFSTRKNINQLSETTVSEFWYNFFLVFQFILLTSIVVFILMLRSEKFLFVPVNSFLVILFFIICNTVFGIIKYWVYRFIGFVFNAGEFIKIGTRSYLVMLEMIGFIAFIPVLLLVYADYFHEIILGFLLALFLISRLIIFYRVGLFFLQSNVNFLFLIAYLCSIEIIPYILLYEGLSYIFKMDIIKWIWL